MTFFVLNYTMLCGNQTLWIRQYPVIIRAAADRHRALAQGFFGTLPRGNPVITSDSQTQRHLASLLILRAQSMAGENLARGSPSGGANDRHKLLFASMIADLNRRL